MLHPNVQLFRVRARHHSCRNTTANFEVLLAALPHFSLPFPRAAHMCRSPINIRKTILPKDGGSTQVPVRRIYKYEHLCMYKRIDDTIIHLLISCATYCELPFDGLLFA